MASSLIRRSKENYADERRISSLKTETANPIMVVEVDIGDIPAGSSRGLHEQVRPDGAATLRSGCSSISRDRTSSGSRRSLERSDAPLDARDPRLYDSRIRRQRIRDTSARGSSATISRPWSRPGFVISPSTGNRRPPGHDVLAQTGLLDVYRSMTRSDARDALLLYTES